jgi:alpha-L-rhamnosidase
VPPALRTQAAQKFADTIVQFNNHLATGFIGTPRLLPALHDAGWDDLACQLLLQETYPSWLYQVKLGATTMWERWDGWTPFSGFQTSIMNSFNHYAFGSVGEYLYSVIGGIKPASPGYSTIVIQPVPGTGLTWANTSYHCIRGVISTAWTNLNNTFNLEVVIPPNTRAQVYVPTTNAIAITESGVLAVNSPGVTYLGLSNGCALYSVGSGRYLWASPLTTPPPPLTVSAISRVDGTNLVFTVGGLASGQRYMLQSTTNLSSGGWLIEADFVAAQTTAAFTNSIADSAQKFYRIARY